MRRPATTMKNAGGVFYQDRYFALLEAATNLIISIIGVKMLGLPGIFIGTIVSGLLIPNIAGPFYLYRDVFGIKFKKYFFKELEYFALTTVTIFPIYCAVQVMPFNATILGFIIQFICVFVITGLSSAVLAFALPERKYTIKYLKIILSIFKKMV